MREGRERQRAGAPPRADGARVHPVRKLLILSLLIALGAVASKKLKEL